MAADLLPAYLVVGSDELKAKSVIARLKKHLEPGFEEFNLDEHVASSDLEPQDLLASLNTLPFGMGPRLVIVTSADHLLKAASEAVISYLEDPNTSCTLLLVAEKLAKSTRLYKAVAKLGKQSIIDCSPAKRWELPKRVSAMAQQRGMRMNQDACEELVARVGESTTMLDTQVGTLCELCRQAGVITRADVERLVVRVAEVKPWDFLDAVCARNASKALELYGLMQNPSEIALTSMIVGRLRELICAQSLAQRGQGGELASALGKAGWQVKNHMGWARRYGRGELARSLALCAECDAHLKTGSDARVEFTRLVLGICGAA